MTHFAANRESEGNVIARPQAARANGNGVVHKAEFADGVECSEGAERVERSEGTQSY